MTNESVQEAVTNKKGREVEVVTMQDGRKIEFAGNRKLLKSYEITPDGIFIRLDFRNGETRDFRIPDSLMGQFAGHGGLQKLGDETAGMKDVDDMVLAVDETIDRLNKGEWSTRTEGGSFAGGSILLRALVEFSGKTVDNIKMFLKEKTPAQKTALRNSVQIKPIIDRMESEKASKGPSVDTQALLGELN